MQKLVFLILPLALIELLSLPKGSAIADVGAGSGGYSQSLANQACCVYAIEPSSVMRSLLVT